MKLSRRGGMEASEYTANPSNRCYFCKHELYTLLQGMAADRGFRSLSMATTSTTRATIDPDESRREELEIRSPLIEAEDAEGGGSESCSGNRASTSTGGLRPACRLKNSVRVVRSLRKTSDDRSSGEEIIRGSRLPSVSSASSRPCCRIEFAPKCREISKVEMFERLAKEFRRSRISIHCRGCSGLSKRSFQRSVDDHHSFEKFSK